MQPWFCRSRSKTEKVAVANMIAQSVDSALQFTAAVEAHRLPTRKFGHLRRQILLHRSKNQSQRRIKLEISLGRPRWIVVGFVRTVGILGLERRIHMRIFERQLRFSLLRGKSNAINRGVRLSQITHNLLHRSLAPVIMLLADQ